MTPRDDQRFAALKAGNEIRARRATLKRDLYAKPAPQSLLAIVEVLENPPAWATGMDITSLLLACRGLGTVKAARIVKAAGVRWPKQPIKRLTPRQRETIMRELHQRAEARAERDQ